MDNSTPDTGNLKTSPETEECRQCRVILAAFVKSLQEKKKPFWRRHWLLLIVLALIAAGGFALAGAGSDALPDDPHVALLEIKGEIKDLSKQTAWLHRLRHADGIKGLLVRVDSPGGSAAVSEVFYEELLEFGKEKPVVVSMGSMAASGGLMISMAGERVFAGEGTVTGSIGVIMQSLHNEKLLDSLGIGYLLYTTGPDKAAGNPMRAPTDAEKEYLQKFMAEICDQFVGVVADRRHLDREKVKAMATGAAFTGRQALKLGLIDEIGGFEKALGCLSEKTGVPADTALVKMPRQDSWREQVTDVLGSIAGDIADRISSRSAPSFRYQLY